MVLKTLLAFTVAAISCTQCTEVNMTGCKTGLPYKIDAGKQPKGDIYSPGFKENVLYPNFLYCEYTISAPPGHKIKLTFKVLDIDPFDMCGKDALFIYDGRDRESPILGSFCGTEPPYPLITSRNALYMLFSTNFLTGRRGFHLSYETTTNSNLCPEGQAQCRNRNCYKLGDKCNGIDNCGDGTDEEDCDFSLPNVECGITPIKPIDSSYGPNRIVGGIGAREGSWPWQVDMQLPYYYPNGHTCGGTLINPQWIMTALHCLRGNALPESWRIHLGNHHKYIKDKNEQVRFVKQIVIFPGYTGKEILGKPVDITHDIALMKLNAPVKITDYVRPACLPPQGYELVHNYKCMSTGWGSTRGTGFSDILKQVELRIRPRNECQGWFENKTMICASHEGGFQDSCHGDSGGPLVCKIGNVWNVMGIVSFGTTSNLLSGNCALPNNGAVYNKVSAKVQWINEMIKRYS